LPAQPTYAGPRPHLGAAGRRRGVHGWPASPVGGPRRTWLVSVAVALLVVVSTVASALISSASMVWPGSQSLSAGVAVNAAVNVHNRGSSDYSEYRVSAGHSHGPPTVVNVQFCHEQTYYVLAGSTPVLVHNVGGPEACMLGKAGEEALGIPSGGKTRIPSATGTANYRVPDYIGKRTVVDSKNVAELDVTDQIRDFHAFAQLTGRQLVLVVRQDTIIGDSLRQMQQLGQVRIFNWLPPGFG
jgi:hypothetical protein